MTGRGRRADARRPALSIPLPAQELTHERRVGIVGREGAQPPIRLDRVQQRVMVVGRARAVAGASPAAGEDRRHVVVCSLPWSHVITSSEGATGERRRARICGTSLASHASPVETGQSSMSLHMLGVMKAKSGVVFADRRSMASCVKGTTWPSRRAALSRMSV